MSDKALPQGGENERRILRRDPNPHLFRPIEFRSVRSKNRIMLSPMCQYSATDGLADDWHFQHLASRAVGGAGIVMTEAVHVSPEARITHHCLGLWNDAQRDRLARIVDFVAARDALPGIQIGHAGRKSGVSRPWEGTQPLTEAEGAWPSLAPSARAYANFAVPKAMDAGDIARAIADFAAATRRARAAGFQVLELHAAHGYLFHQFYSPLSNAREDDYGGAFGNRVRLLLETLDAVRAEWPAELPLFVRLSATEWVEGGWELDDTIRLARMLAERGDVDLIDVSSGANDPRQQIPIHPGYQIPLAEAVRRESGLATGALGLIHSPEAAEEVIANGRADLVVMGRALMHDPYWPLHAAAVLKAQTVRWPVQYERSNIF